MGDIAKPFTSYADGKMIPLFTATGMPIEVHEKVANRLGLKPGDVWIAEDDEAIWGDIGSAPGQIGAVGDSMWQSIKGWFGDESPSIVKRGHTGAGPIAPPVQAAPPLLTVQPPARPFMRREAKPGWMGQMFQ